MVWLVFIVVTVYVMIFAAAQALMTGVAQARGMTGRLSAVFGIGYFTPAVLSALAGTGLPGTVIGEVAPGSGVRFA